MKKLPLISKSDYSILHTNRILSGYSSAVHQIFTGEIDHSPSFFLYDKNSSIYGVSETYFQYPITEEEMEKIAPYLIKLEDRRFYQHNGIDWRGMFRAALTNLHNVKIVQGGSTITMQLVRNTIIEKSPSMIRKIIEMKLAKALETNFSKKEILRLYCDNVYMGKKLRGLQSASYFIYRKPISQLNDIQISGLLGLLRSPESFSPFRSTSKYISRQKFISSNLTGKEIHHTDSINPIKIDIPVFERHSRLVHKDLKLSFNKESIKIKRLGTTIDLHIQHDLDKILREVSTKNPEAMLSTVILENSNGYILAESSWKNGRQMIFSPVFEGYVHPGSTFKTFALISALEQGYGLGTKLLSAPFSSNIIKDKDGEYWSVKNYKNIYRGEITLLDAFVHSDNCAFARLAELIDHNELFSVYKRFGLINNEDVVYPSIILGGLPRGAKFINVALAYQSLANNGYKASNFQFTKYCEFSDNSLYYKSPDVTNGHNVIAADILLDVNKALKAAALSYGFRNLHAKTGTSDIGKIIAAYDNKKTLVSFVENIVDFWDDFWDDDISKNTSFQKKQLNKFLTDI